MMDHISPQSCSLATTDQENDARLNKPLTNELAFPRRGFSSTSAAFVVCIGKTLLPGRHLCLLDSILS